jgi:hypothetical protein
MSEVQMKEAEAGLLQVAVSDAAERATSGELAEGYAILLAGLRRAEELASSGEPWAVELAEGYRKAIGYFDFKYTEAAG